MNDLKFQEETRQSKGRVDYIDLAKFFGIFCMVLCHSGMHNFLTQFIYAFHMPLFFFLSGYLFDRGKLRATVPYISKKFFSIMVPYAIFSLVLCFGKKGMTDWGYLLYASRDSIAQAESFTPLWFLPCFFLSSVIYFLISKFTSRNSLFYYGVIAFVAVVGFMLSSFRGRFLWGYPGNFDVALTGVALMGAGEVVKRLNFNNTAWGGVFLFIGGWLSFFNLPTSLTEGNPHVEMATSSYGNPFLFIIVAILLCAAIIVMCKKICELQFAPRITSLLSYYGANTITILCFHGVFVSILRMIFRKLGHNNFVMEPIVVTLICFILLYPVIRYVSKEFPNMVGRRL